MPTGTPTNETNAEIETHSLTAETKSNLKPYTRFSPFHSLTHCFIFTKG